MKTKLQLHHEIVEELAALMGISDALVDSHPEHSEAMLIGLARIALRLTTLDLVTVPKPTPKEKETA